MVDKWRNRASQGCTIKMAQQSSSQNNHFLFITPNFYQKILSGIRNHQVRCHDGFMMITMSKGWREGINRSAITNNQHAPNRYYSLPSSKYNTYNIYILYLLWLTSYCLLDFTSATTSIPEDKIKILPYHKEW